MRNRKRAMVMIFVVIMVAAATTIIAASVDLSRMATLKQDQSEREAKWQYCVESAKNLVVENMIGLSGTSQTFNKTINGISLSIGAQPDLGWNSNSSTQIAVRGILDGNTRLSNLYVGKRSTVVPCQFGVFATSKFFLDETFNLNSDIYLAGSVTAKSLWMTGNIYSSSATAPTVASLTGSFIGRQPGLSITLNDALYAAQANITTSGTTTLKNPTNLLSLTNSQLRYHTGNLTITGTTTGEITIYVSGSVTLKNVQNAISVLGRLVVICNGDVLIDPGVTDVFVISNGKVKSTSGSGSRTINGSLAGSEISNSGNAYTVNFDNYFVSNRDGGTRYWIPGQW